MEVLKDSLRFFTGCDREPENSRDTVFMATITYQGLEVLYTRQQIASRVAEMGAQITHDLNEEKLVMVGVLKGAAIFLADPSPLR